MSSSSRGPVDQALGFVGWQVGTRLSGRLDPLKHASSASSGSRARRVDVPDAISVALEEGPLTPDAPAADLAHRVHRLTYPEPFAQDPVQQFAAAAEHEAIPKPDRPRGPIAR